MNCGHEWVASTRRQRVGPLGRVGGLAPGHVLVAAELYTHTQTQTHRRRGLCRETTPLTSNVMENQKRNVGTQNELQSY